MKQKNKKGYLFSMLLGTLGASLLGNMLPGKGINRAEYGFKDLESKGGKGIIRAGYRFKGSLINDSRDNIPNKIKDGAYVINMSILMSILILELIGLLCMYLIIMVLILIVSELNTFQKKLNDLLVIKT